MRKKKGRGWITGPQNQRFRSKKGCFCKTKSAKRGCFSNSAMSMVYALVGVGGWSVWTVKRTVIHRLTMDNSHMLCHSPLIASVPTLLLSHYCDDIMGTMASQITSLTIVYSTVYSDADQRKHESSASLAFVRGIHRGPVNSPHQWPATRKMVPFYDVIMKVVKTLNYSLKS